MNHLRNMMLKDHDNEDDPSASEENESSAIHEAILALPHLLHEPSIVYNASLQVINSNR